jgi:hypothetical protein
MALASLDDWPLFLNHQLHHQYLSEYLLYITCSIIVEEDLDCFRRQPITALRIRCQPRGTLSAESITGYHVTGAYIDKRAFGQAHVMDR